MRTTSQTNAKGWFFVSPVSQVICVGAAKLLPVHSATVRSLPASCASSMSSSADGFPSSSTVLGVLNRSGPADSVDHPVPLDHVRYRTVLMLDSAYTARASPETPSNPTATAG